MFFSTANVLLKTKKPSIYYSFFLKEVFFCTFAWLKPPFAVKSMLIKIFTPSGLAFLLLAFFLNIQPAQSLQLDLFQDSEYPVVFVDGNHFYEYTVQVREGFFRLRVKFGLSEDEIIRLNPHAKDGLQAGMKLLIPVSKEEVKKLTSSKQQYIEHVVEKKQTIFRIRKMYSLTEEEMLEHNPQLRDRTLREGDVLKIPVKNADGYGTVAKSGQSEKQLTTPENKLTKKTDSLGTKAIPPTIRARKQHYKIAFLLPFMLDQRNEASDSRFVEFYSGALLAIHQAKAKGRQIEVYTFDTEKSDLRMMEILTNDIMEEVDLIVGPAYSNHVPMVCDFARIHKINTIIPFTSRIFDLNNNPYLYQFNPGQEAELHKLFEVLTGEYRHTNLVLMENPYVATTDEGSQLVAQLKVLLRNAGREFRTLTVDPANTTALRNAVETQRENLFIFNTNRITTLSGQLRQLAQLSDSFAVKIYEPYAWKTSKTEKPSSFYLSIFRNEYPEKEYEDYMQLFASVFNWLPSTEHPRYDLLGFDLLNYYFASVDLPVDRKKQHYPVFEGIQSTILFEKTAERGGYINKQLNHFE